MTSPADRSPSRRDVLRYGVASGAALTGVPLLAGCAGASRALTDLGARVEPARRIAAGAKIRVAVIGIGGKGYSDMKGVAHEDLVALCEVDKNRGAKALAEFPGLPLYADYREMLDREDLDAVVISTPDHMHAPPAAMALRKGLHVFCQKPLTHTVEEARLLTKLAAESGAVTQMGNQGTAADNFRAGVEAVRSGVLGEIREVHVWTNRPVWPQGMDRPAGAKAIPEHLRWNLWLGAAPHRPYNDGYAPFAWRGFWDFGTGALGDMACHIMNLPYTALDLGAPTRVSAESEGNNHETAPNGSRVTFEFPAQGDRGPVKLYWYDGTNRPDPAIAPGVDQLAHGGSCIVGARGSFYSWDDYGTQWALLPEARFADWVPPAPELPRGANIHREWLDAIRDGGRPSSSFLHAGPFTETVLLGNVAIRLGRAIRWDAAAMAAVGDPEADRYLRKEYRRGFGIRG